MKIISSFRGEYDFLSNFYMIDIPFTVSMDMTVWKSSEHLYQAAKFMTVPFVLNNEPPEINLGRNDIVKEIFNAPTPGKAKRIARKNQHLIVGGFNVSTTSTLDPGKLSAMWDILTKKFSIPEMRDKLLATGDARLIEGNTWGDTYWGVCNGKGENHLGRMLMKVRDYVKYN